MTLYCCVLKIENSFRTQKRVTKRKIYAFMGKSGFSAHNLVSILIWKKGLVFNDWKNTYIKIGFLFAICFFPSLCFVTFALLHYFSLPRNSKTIFYLFVKHVFSSYNLISTLDLKKGWFSMIKKTYKNWIFSICFATFAFSHYFTSLHKENSKPIFFLPFSLSFLIYHTRILFLSTLLSCIFLSLFNFLFLLNLCRNMRKKHTHSS